MYQNTEVTHTQVLCNLASEKFFAWGYGHALDEDFEIELLPAPRSSIKTK